MNAIAALARRLLAVVLLAAVGGCAGYSSVRDQLQTQLADGHTQAALALLGKEPPSDRDRVAWLLDEATLLRLNGDYAASNATFERAKKAIDDLTAVSLREQASALVVNDTLRSYTGEPFEQALLHTYMALNYLALGDHDGARVEALQVDETLQRLAENSDGPFSRDPFARFLAGLIYEMAGEPSDALIAYRKSLQALDAQGKRYPVTIPRALQVEMLRLTDQLGLKQEHKELLARFGTEAADAGPKEGQGELVVLFQNGLVPLKRERISMIYPPAAPRLVAIALPYYQPCPSRVVAARIRGTDGQEVTTEILENIQAIALNSLDDALPGITARAIVRAVAKYQLADRAEKKNGGFAGAAVNIAGLLTERADTRSWMTLPAQIQVARLVLPAGKQQVELDLEGAAGAMVARKHLDVTVEAGTLTVVSYRWIDPPLGRK